MIYAGIALYLVFYVFTYCFLRLVRKQWIGSVNWDWDDVISCMVLSIIVPLGWICGFCLLIKINKIKPPKWL